MKSEGKNVQLVQETPKDNVHKNEVYEKKENIKHIKVDISLRTIFTILLIIAAIYFGSKLLTVLGILFFSFIISSALLPFVRWLMSKGLNKGLSVAIVYVCTIILLIVSLSLIVIPFISESQKLIADLPKFVNDMMLWIKNFEFNGVRFDSLGIQEGLDGFVNSLSSFTANSGADGFKTILGALGNVAGGVMAVVTVLLISIYMVFDHDNFLDLLLLRIFDEEQRLMVRKLVVDVEGKLGSWMSGQIVLSLVIGLLSWILLTVLKVPFALPLAVMAGLLESIPSLGPTISLIPTVLIALLMTNPLTSFFVFLGYLVIQQLENTFIVPKVMSNAVGIKPIVVIIAVTVGFALIGPIGALLSVPIAVLVDIGITFYKDLQKLQAKGNL